MDLNLESKIVIVTGGAQGIGRAACLAFSKNGASVAVVDIDLQGAQRVAGEITGNEGIAIAVQADVSDQTAVESALGDVITAFGRVDILVNNAAIEVLTPMVSARVEDWDKVIATNLRGTFLFTRAVIPHMLSQGGGSIVNVGSIDGKRGRAKGAAYAASKAGIICFTEALADEMAQYKIRANVVCPAGVNTAMWRLTHADVDPFSVLQPEEVADLIVFLGSDLSAAINGASLEVLGPRLEIGTYL